MANLEELFSRMPTALRADKAGDMNAVVQFDLTGDGGGQWTVTIADGVCTTSDGTAENPTATLRMDADDYLDLLAGRLNPVQAFMTGKVKVEGDLNTIMKFQTIFDYTAEG